MVVTWAACANGLSAWQSQSVTPQMCVSECSIDLPRHTELTDPIEVGVPLPALCVLNFIITLSR